MAECTRDRQLEVRSCEGWDERLGCLRPASPRVVLGGRSRVSEPPPLRSLSCAKGGSGAPWRAVDQDHRSDYRPLFHLGEWPVTAAGLLVILHCAAMLLGVFVGFPAGLMFNSEAVLRQLAVWQLVTYAFLNGPSIWFAIEMYLLYVFGRDLERFLGRAAFLRLYGLLLLAPPCFFLVWGLIRPVTLAGASAVHFAVFIAFVTLYPGVMFFFNLRAKWIALVLLAIGVLQALAARNYPALAALLLSAALAYAYIRRVRGLTLVPGIEFRFGSGEPRPKVVRKPRKPAGDDPTVIMDRLLEKISRSGLSSLSAKERAQLESARQRMTGDSRS